jgi:phosphoglycerate dehydrogenase-like enzyme
VAFLRGYDKTITELERIDELVLTQLPELKAIGKYGVGLDMIDLESMRKHGMRLSWTGGVNRRSVSELVISFIVAMLRQLPQAHQAIKNGVWRQHAGGLLSG